ncbi:class I SAM-dependent methyltransferase [Nodularia sphaerocarpa]|uniref:class I SAM-dependent methyltransferase n=1 Tax=Nodularia sphaerocarpa TaxID=137816 RepID=UPI001EFA7B4B|nr:class I SAM-dependent methyltransferase [Nodularia sphaerocarpa]MDB9375004.1 class I SAM-dependent methyltransferase [Nodularia sphaerocarpa CS-585]MDB9377683.1 class I SAM-dependent methyltransferase [Nodularia sphaerocarpa CS-585A2]ULP74202.1 putative methyltransferase YcgJ [Nodularia sphaerocarpa UHCC 0038]
MFQFDKNSEEEIQRRYYAETAYNYDQLHVYEKDTHYFALCFMVGAMEFLNVKSILDVGAGTGRSIAYIKQRCSGITIKGIEPVKELREVGYAKGISSEDLIQGDGLQIPFDDKSFDIVCCFGVLHHIKTPRLVIQEMLRVSNKAIFISDSNNFGQGSFLSRTLKQGFNTIGLWPFVNFIKTKGKGYSISEGDGLAYSYSVFTDYNYIRRECKSVHLMNTSNIGGANLYKNSENIGILGIKS